MRRWHLAQINVARALAPSGSEVMTGFYARISAINALADASPGFVWRLQDDSGNATSIQTSEDPYLLVNMSVWESIEALKDFVYRSSHAGVFADRARWFEKPSQPHQALWWIPAGHIPTTAEGYARLDLLRSVGPGPEAFTFAHPSPPPADQP